MTRGAGPTTRKVAAASRDPAARLLEDTQRVTSVLDLKFADHSHHRDVIRAVRWSLVRSKQFTGLYASPYESKPKRLILDPYRLCLVKQAWYPIACAEDADQPRTFRLARFRSLRTLGTPATVSADFDLKNYFGNA